mmetsp:Transcript_10634/g.10478  ORF Transcript_10634/g.10478 Transcript_10634/m.10478 type:complete len:137 (+) Transcript_10634:116-526(+)|eukprot:CAMPEP_0196996148 /NCGR_PEP_ID=MMETSP1380-20130617/2109_1 /TAXON_ID=5936 /ORGANISM="Euplotes crassus, Strain CT5" /LENGTH=136 /DNA_ID=CAMNT_0042412033 /DNA_START=114 /DNA_END=524 /DNA_ORIENTATION=-
MEMSHRSKEFIEIMQNAENDFRELMEIPEEFEILMLPAGGSMQFSAVPMNLLTKNKKANYLVFGSWGKSAINHAKRYADDITEVVDPDSIGNTIPDFSTWKIDPEAKYFHYCDNETIYGIEINDFPFEELKDQLLV